MKIVSTLDNPKLIKSGRRQGNTTRLVNCAIEKLFEGCVVIVLDHYPHPRADKHLLDRIVSRYEKEHNTQHKKIVIEKVKNKYRLHLEKIKQ